MRFTLINSIYSFTISCLIIVSLFAVQAPLNNVIAQSTAQTNHQQILSKFNSWKEKQFVSGTYATKKIVTLIPCYRKAIKALKWEFLKK